jgi:hypothetical protein
MLRCETSLFRGRRTTLERSEDTFEPQGRPPLIPARPTNRLQLPMLLRILADHGVALHAGRRRAALQIQAQARLHPRTARSRGSVAAEKNSSKSRLARNSASDKMPAIQTAHDMRRLPKPRSAVETIHRQNMEPKNPNRRLSPKPGNQSLSSPRTGRTPSVPFLYMSQYKGYAMLQYKKSTARSSKNALPSPANRRWHRKLGGLPRSTNTRSSIQIA